MKSKKQIIILSSMLVILLLAVVGATYAWFSTNITGGEGKLIVSTATIGPLRYTVEEITGEYVLPGWISEDGTITVEGNVQGNQPIEYYCTMKNTGGITDVEYRISADGASNSTGGEWKSIDGTILSGSISSTNAQDVYEYAIRFKETGGDQNSQKGLDIGVKIECFIEEVGSTKLLSEQILADNPNVSTRSTFNETFTASNNGNTIYKASGQDGLDTYYFAGAVTNNYVKFGTNSSGQQLYWRIVRINEDGSVRLIYAGTSATDTAAFINTSLSFNSTYSNSAYVGYMYQISGKASDAGVSQSSTIQHGLATSSDIKKELDTWYASNLENNYDKYISKTAIYCNDRTVGSGTWSAIGSNFYYGAYTRLNTNKAPTYTCTEPNDQFTASSSVGNGALSKPIALITVDEVAYAGGLTGTPNTEFYISQNASSVVDRWWTMSPLNWFGLFASEFSVGGSSSTGYLNGNFVSNVIGVRPVISLKSCVNWSKGNGTVGDEYEVTVSDACASLEN